jgi:hypothetical protein
MRVVLRDPRRHIASSRRYGRLLAIDPPYRLSLLGEMRSQSAAPCLASAIARFPSSVNNVNAPPIAALSHWQHRKTARCVAKRAVAIDDVIRIAANERAIRSIRAQRIENGESPDGRDR